MISTLERLKEWIALAEKRNKERDYVTFAIGNDAVDEVFEILPKLLAVVDEVDNYLVGRTIYLDRLRSARKALDEEIRR